MPPKKKPAAADEATEVKPQPKGKVTAKAKADSGIGEQKPSTKRKCDELTSGAEAMSSEAQEEAVAEGEPVLKAPKADGPTTLRSLQDVLAPIRKGLAAETQEEQMGMLQEVVAELQNKWDLLVGGTRFALAELESYVHSPTHEDPYTHGDDGQGSCGVWYFHRHGGSYKGGSFKGMDLACGHASAKVHAGLLVRAVRSLDPADTKLVEGPSLVVDEILKRNSKASIAAFADGRAAADLPADSVEGLTLVPSEQPRDDAVWLAPRVGLVLRADTAGKTHSEGQPSAFVARPYRFSTSPQQLTKFRAGFAATKYIRSGRSPAVSAASLATELKLAQAKLTEYLAATDKGLARGGKLDGLVDRKIATASDLCELVGACSAVPPS